MPHPVLPGGILRSAGPGNSAPLFGPPGRRPPARYWSTSWPVKTAGFATRARCFAAVAATSASFVTPRRPLCPLQQPPPSHFQTTRHPRAFCPLSKIHLKRQFRLCRTSHGPFGLRLRWHGPPRCARLAARWTHAPGIAFSYLLNASSSGPRFLTTLGSVLLNVGV
jgi:hypothetical protein